MSSQDNAIENTPTKTAQELQQELAGIFGAKGIIWDLFNAEDQGYLMRKIGILFPCTKANDSKSVKENAKLEKHRDLLLETIWNQRKYYGGKLLMSQIYVVCTKLLENEKDALNELKYTILPLFRVRKCLKNDDSSNCCVIFIDDTGRVYQSWADYKENNTLPEGIVVAPSNGYYNFSDDELVNLECFRTPASKLLAQAANVANTTAGVVGFGAAAVTVAALALPVAAPVLAGAAIAGLGSGIWGAVSSIGRLVDRGQHEQSINVTDSQARADWLGVAGGAVTLGSSGATALLSRYAATGRNVSEIVRGSVNVLNITTIAVNGVGVGNGIFEIILKKMNDEDISAIDVAQLGVSLFLVTHSVYNFRTASQIVNQSRDSKIQNIRKELSNRQRKAFDRTYRETIRLNGAEKGKMDVIRSLNSMPESKQPLNDLFKINKQLNENNLKASFNPDGNIRINNDLIIDSATLRQNLQFGSPESIVQNAGAAPTSYHADNLNSTSLRPQYNFNPLNPIAIKVMSHVVGIVGALVSEKIGDTAIMMRAVGNILEEVSVEALDWLLDVVRMFYSEFMDDFQQAARRFIPYEETLWKAFEMIKEMCGGHNLEIFIQNVSGRFIIQKLKEFYKDLLPRLGESHKCKVCGGFYTISAI